MSISTTELIEFCPKISQLLQKLLQCAGDKKPVTMGFDEISDSIIELKKIQTNMEFLEGEIEDASV